MLAISGRQLEVAHSGYCEEKEWCQYKGLCGDECDVIKIELNGSALQIQSVEIPHCTLLTSSRRSAHRCCHNSPDSLRSQGRRSGQ